MDQSGGLQQLLARGGRRGHRLAHAAPLRKSGLSFVRAPQDTSVERSVSGSCAMGGSAPEPRPYLRTCSTVEACSSGSLAASDLGTNWSVSSRESA